MTTSFVIHIPVAEGATIEEVGALLFRGALALADLNADDDPCRASTIARIYPEATVSPAAHAVAR